MNDSIGIVLTLYKRDTINIQLKALLNQSIKPKVIFIWQNESHVDLKIHEDIKNAYKDIGIEINHIHSKTKNFKFHGRFTVPLLMDTDYVAIFDDDTIPGSRWLENCIFHIKKFNCIIGANGRTINNQETLGELGFGDGSEISSSIYVDFVGHCWFFKREWSHFMWSFQPSTFENGEDIHFAASAYIKGGIRCMVPVQPNIDKTIWGDTNVSLGWDEHATWKKPDHGSTRLNVKKYWLEKGWQPLLLSAK